MGSTRFTHSTGKAAAVLLSSLLLVTALHPACADALPSPSRTVYKCAVAGKTAYSDSPCLGASRLEIEPTRGVNKLSGRERIGADVRREQQREAFADAIRPLTGMDAKQFDIQSRRMSLPGAAQQECLNLDSSIPVVESEEKHSAPPQLAGIQKRLFEMRLRFKTLRC
jgi:hypothetical protein